MWWLPYAVAGGIILTAIYSYNKLVGLENRVENAWSQIAVQLQRRQDVIPNIIRLAKKYAAHEKDIIRQLSEARQRLSDAQTPKENADAEETLSRSIKKLFAVAEDYPDLKADTNFLELQEEISSTENKIAYARQHYNDITTAYNTALESIPHNIIAALFKFQHRELFKSNVEGDR